MTLPGLTQRAALLLLPILALCALPAHAADTAPPNIVFLFIDDMGWGDFSCFGNEEAETPNIDRLAAEGICFDQFYVNSPICSSRTGPSRWASASVSSNWRRRLDELANADLAAASTVSR